MLLSWGVESQSLAKCLPATAPHRPSPQPHPSTTSLLVISMDLADEISTEQTWLNVRQALDEAEDSRIGRRIGHRKYSERADTASSTRSSRASSISSAFTERFSTSSSEGAAEGLDPYFSPIESIRVGRWVLSCPKTDLTLPDA